MFSSFKGNTTPIVCKFATLCEGGRASLYFCADNVRSSAVIVVPKGIVCAEETLLSWRPFLWRTTLVVYAPLASGVPFTCPLFSVFRWHGIGRILPHQQCVHNTFIVCYKIGHLRTQLCDFLRKEGVLRFLASAPIRLGEWAVRDGRKWAPRQRQQVVLLCDPSKWKKHTVEWAWCDLEKVSVPQVLPDCVMNGSVIAPFCRFGLRNRATRRKLPLFHRSSVNQNTLIFDTVQLHCVVKSKIHLVLYQRLFFYCPIFRELTSCPTVCCLERSHAKPSDVGWNASIALKDVYEQARSASREAVLGRRRSSHANRSVRSSSVPPFFKSA